MLIEPLAANPILTREEAREILEPHLLTFRDCIDGGWNAWKEHYKDRAHILDPRARAAIVYCEIRELAKAAFDGKDGVKIVVKRSMFLLYIGEHIVLRFKKFRADGRCSNVRTKQQALFSAQLNIDGILPGTYVNAGYTLDNLQAEVEKILINCQLGARILWTIRPGEAAPPETMPLPAPSPMDPPLRERTRLRQHKVPRKIEESQG